MKYKLGVIGVGVMGHAILSCILDKGILKKSEIGIYDICQEKTTIFNNVNVFTSAQDLVSDCEFILFAIKPQHFEELSKKIDFNSENKIISIMAGLKIARIRENTSDCLRIARVMPNTPCKIGQGMCAVAFEGFDENDKNFIISLLNACGKVIPIDERYFDAVTSISGSGPAYVYMFIDSMINGGMDGGLTYEQSKTLSVQTLIGTALLALNSNESMSDLTEKVCSKGGTTIEAVNVYREKQLDALIREGIAACKKRSEEMGNLL